MKPCVICGLSEEEGIEEHVCPPGFTESMAREIDWPLDQWTAQCHGVSSFIAPKVGGVVRRGQFLGDVNPSSYFGIVSRLKAPGPIFQQHSWVELSDARVLDPTRHAFVGGAPMLWQGPYDEYDIGGCKMQRPTPPPDPFEGNSQLDLELSSIGYFEDLLGISQLGLSGYDNEEDEEEGMGPGWITVTAQQCHWLAHLPIRDKEEAGVCHRFFAAELYDAIEKAGQGALIPIDRRHWILGEDT